MVLVGGKLSVHAVWPAAVSGQLPDVGSIWVKAEATAAQHENKLWPVLIETVRIPMPFQRRQERGHQHAQEERADLPD
jgi:hypothetical protein